MTHAELVRKIVEDVRELIENPPEVERALDRCTVLATVVVTAEQYKEHISTNYGWDEEEDEWLEGCTHVVRFLLGEEGTSQVEGDDWGYSVTEEGVELVTEPDLPEVSGAGLRGGLEWVALLAPEKYE